MIKFFRHIRKRLISENKFTKYLAYAFGEIILVVIGILIALQINTWNQARINSNLEKELLINLKNEFITNQSILKNMIQNHEAIKTGCDDFLKIVGPENKPIDELEFDILVGQSGWTPSYSPQKGVLNSTLNSGKISLIKNDSLVFSLSSLSRPEKGYYETVGLINKLTEESIIPLLLKNYSYMNMQTGKLSSKTRSNFKTDQKAILQNQEMESLLYLKRLNTAVAIEQANWLYAAQESILNLINSQLIEYSDD
ncbi:DUF6090 family protein [Urechidicola vernalis]|uniref:DUF6090 family protein n=1 Tax=Urechidicola vernalis TaxID=3075600 RepID=A0ABU2Y8G4_9FLAO|nr:DUF6090 family protein [Urechidicola sp. P050]MDT0554100.1 DUF6090 family protein [Urechidicola sp. P050]